MQVKISQAISMISLYLRAGLVPFLTGSPGMGKSDIIRQVATQYNLFVIDLRLSQCDPTDLLGFPTIKGDKAGYVPMDTFPIEGDSLPTGYSGWLLFFDEFNSAPTSVQAAAYKIILDRMIGQKKLHKNAVMACAGNLDTDGAIVNTMSTALQSRLAHLELTVDHKEWVEWAAISGIDHRVSSYIQFKPGSLYTFMADHTDKTYACPRTWAFASKVLGVVDINHADALPMLAGVLSEGVGREFLTFCKIENTLPKPHQIEANPDTIVVPDEPSVLYALTGSLSHNATDSNFTNIMKYVKRLPVEFQVVTLRDTVRRNKEMLKHSAVKEWIKESSVSLF